MDVKTDNIINQEILDITEAIKAAVPAQRIYLFGSYAYGTPHKDSDYDFFVVIPDGELKPVDAMIQARLSLINIKNRKPIDILANYASNFDETAQFATMERKIKRDGVLLYANN